MIRSHFQVVSRLLRQSAGTSRSYNFASPQYVSCFGDYPVPDKASLAASTLTYLESFDEKLWHDDPIRTLLNDKEHKDGTAVDTHDAFNKVNGKIVHATSLEVDLVIDHVNNYTPPVKDYRSQVRAIEDELLSEFPGFLIGNQAVDFRKQDGVTEIEESIEANPVERRMNDLLISDESAGKIKIDRSPAFVGCVSNFSNFLDLFRKTIRNLEVGVPCVILSRSNTTQHMYRWSVLLRTLCEKHGVDLGMVTYFSADLPEIKRVFASSPSTCPMHITCSRELAKAVKSDHPNTMSSTGGPNTLVAPRLTSSVKEAIRFSAMIENSGQCTALRHAVVPNASEMEIESLFDGAPVVTTPQDSLRAGEFAGIFEDSPVEPTPEGYTKVNGLNAHYKVSGELPEDGVEEYWRKVFVDVTSPSSDGLKKGGKDAEELASWLVRNQPISLAINMDDELGQYLFERTGQVVYTVGTEENPALTCQARPQEGEIFGEFPVRAELQEYTKFPVVVPTPTAAYNASYDSVYLDGLGSDPLSKVGLGDLASMITSPTVLGYCSEIVSYLSSSVGPKPGYGARTALWGLQRPPLDGRVTVLRVGKGATVDDLAAKLVVFASTNASEQAVVQVEEGSDPSLRNAAASTGLEVVSEAPEDCYNVVMVGPEDDVEGYGIRNFPMVGQFSSLYLGVGHIKSTMGGDEEFVKRFEKSKKWLEMRKAA